MEKNLKKQIVKLRPFKIECGHNGFSSGLIMKREITFQEANHIMNKIFGIPTDLSLSDFDDKEEFEERKHQLVKDISDLIKGDGGFDWISNEWANDEALDDLNPIIFIDMLRYLIQKDIIK